MKGSPLPRTKLGERCAEATAHSGSGCWRLKAQLRLRLWVVFIGVHAAYLLAHCRRKVGTLPDLESCSTMFGTLIASIGGR